MRAEDGGGAPVHPGAHVRPHLDGGRYRPGHRHAVRALKTAYGEVTYARQYLIARRGGGGFFPLDAASGLTPDRLTPWVRPWVAHLPAHATCRAVLRWEPATETIEQVVLGMGAGGGRPSRGLPKPV